MGRFRSLHDPETLAELVRRLREGIYVSDPEGRVLDANPAFLEMLGVGSLEELRAVPAERLFVDPEQRQRELEVLRRDGVVQEFEFDLLRPDGQVRTVLDTGYSVVDPDTGETLFHGILIDITERKELEHRLREQGIRDPLTGCFNRRFLPELERRGLSGPGTWGVAMVDIDHFKEVNDRRGHKAGDEVLVALCDFLHTLIRDSDAVLRTGGDEFLVVVLDRDVGDVERALERIAHEIAERAPIPSTVATSPRAAGESLEETIIRADLALVGHRADDRGRPGGPAASAGAEPTARRRSPPGDADGPG